MEICPICKIGILQKINPPEDSTSYVITSVNTNTNPPSFNATSGLPVDLMGCKNCGTVLLYCDSLK